MVKARGFELVEPEHRVGQDYNLPTLGSKYSAAYDMYSTEKAVIEPGEKHAFFTNIKAYMQYDEVLLLNVRSSIGIKKHLSMCNEQGWIDADYYGNESNDGNIIICLFNHGKESVTIGKGERIAQGMFIKRLPADNISSMEDRTGGVGSTGK